MRWRLPALGVIAGGALVAAAACSSFGSNSDSPATPDEAGAPDSAPDAPPLPDGAVPSCPSPLRVGADLTKLETSQSADAGLEVTPTSVHGTVNLPADLNATANAFVTTTLDTDVSSVVLEHDLTITKTDMYTEIGCVLTFSGADSQANSLLPYSELLMVAHPGGNKLNAEIDEYHAGGSTTPQDTTLRTLGAGSMHVSVSLEMLSTPGRVKGTLTIDSTSTPIDGPIPRPTKQVRLSCGLYFARGLQDGGTSDITVSNVSATICP